MRCWRRPYSLTHKDPPITYFSYPRHCVSEGRADIPERAHPSPPGETTLTTVHHHVPPDYWIGCEENRRQQPPCVSYRTQGQQAPDQIGCEEALWHGHGQGQHPDLALCREEDPWSTGCWLWCFVCCRQNWDCRNWAQLAESKYKFFFTNQQTNKQPCTCHCNVCPLLTE